jgi:Mg2+/Co2+ transporter CorB
MDAVTLGALLIVLMILSALISATETSFSAASRARVYALAKQKNRRALRLERLLERPDYFMGAILLSNNVIHIFASSLTTKVFIDAFGAEGIVYATLVMSCLIIIFGEMLPKTLALNQATETALWLSRLGAFLTTLCFPVIFVTEKMISVLFRLFGLNHDKQDLNMIRAELRGAIDLSHSVGGVFKDEKERLGGLLNLRDLDVSEVMIHRKNMAIMDVNDPPAQLIKQVLHTPYTRIPLYKDNPENIVGVLHAKDVLRGIVNNPQSSVEALNIEAIMRKPWFIPETTSVADQLNRFLSRRNHFAVVVDEYGVLKGLITLEDILEEIVGDIRDEHDMEILGVHPQPDGSFLIEGTTPIRDMNRKCDWTLPDQYSSTMAGLVMYESRCLPEKGQIFHFYGIRFEILERKRNQITKIRVSPQKGDQA